jgi:hypothetical protein
VASKRKDPPFPKTKTSKHKGVYYDATLKVFRAQFKGRFVGSSTDEDVCAHYYNEAVRMEAEGNWPPPKGQRIIPKMEKPKDD